MIPLRQGEAFCSPCLHGFHAITPKKKMLPEPHSSEDSVKEALDSWQVVSSPDPDFHRSVWRRLSARDCGEPVNFWWWIEPLSRPAVAASIATVMILLASGSATIKSRIDAAAGLGRLEKEYVASIDPLLKFHEVRSR